MRKAATVRVGNTSGAAQSFASSRRSTSPRRPNSSLSPQPRPFSPRARRRKVSQDTVSFNELKAMLVHELEDNKRPYQVLKRWDEAIRWAAEDPSKHAAVDPVLDKDVVKLVDNIRALTKDDHTLLLKALREEKTKALGVNSITSASLKSSLPRGRSQLHTFARLGDADEISALFASEAKKLKANVQGIDQRDFQGQTALHHAVLGKSERTIDSLIKLSASVDAADDLQETPLHLACRIGLTATDPVVKSLVEHGADVERKNREGRSPAELLGEAVRGFAPKPASALATESKQNQERAKDTASLLTLSHKERVGKAGESVLAHIQSLLTSHGLDPADTPSVLDAALIKLKAAAASRSLSDSSSPRPAAPPPSAGPSRRDRYRGCLLGLAVCDAIALAAHSRNAPTLKHLNSLVGGPAGPLDTQVFTRGAGNVSLAVPCGQFGVEVGGWSDRTGGCLCEARSLLGLKGQRVADVLLRLLRMARTGEGMSTPGRCPGLDTQTDKALAWFQLHGWKGGGVTAGMGHGEFSSAALARVAPLAMLLCRDEGGRAAVSGAGEDARATHDAVPSVDASRYLAAVLSGVLAAGPEQGAGAARERALSRRYAPVEGLWQARPLVRDVREVADGGYKPLATCPPASRDAAPLVLGQALWALHASHSFQAGLDALLAGGGLRGAVAVYGSLAGAVYGVGGLPEAWVELLAKREEVVEAADALLAMEEERHKDREGGGGGKGGGEERGGGAEGLGGKPREKRQSDIDG